MTGWTGQEGEYEGSLPSVCYPSAIPLSSHPSVIRSWFSTHSIALLYRVCNEKPILEANKLRQFSEMANNAKFAGFFAK